MSHVDGMQAQIVSQEPSKTQIVSHILCQVQSFISRDTINRNKHFYWPQLIKTKRVCMSSVETF